MNIKIMKWLDHWVGIPLCIIFGLIESVARIPYGKKIPFIENPRRILISKYFGMGSIVLILPLLRAIRRRFPSAEIIFITFSSNLPLLNLAGICDKVIPLDNKKPWIFLKDLFSNLFWINLHSPDIAIDLEFYSKFATLVTFFSGAKRRVGFYLPSFWRKSLINVPINFNYNRHISEIYASVSKAIGIEEYDPDYIKLNPTDAARAKVKEFLIQKGWGKEDRFIGINVNASDLAYCRRWPAQNFIELIETLTSKPKSFVVLTGSRDEKGYTGNIYNKLSDTAKNKTIDLSGKLSLEEFIALLDMLSLYITNDSGPLHLACNQGAVTLSLWGPGTPSLYGPLTKRHKVIYSKFPCSPCMYIYRTDAGYFCDFKSPCLENISPNTVISGALDLLDSPFC